MTGEPAEVTPTWLCDLGDHEGCNGYACECCARGHSPAPAPEDPDRWERWGRTGVQTMPLTLNRPAVMLYHAFGMIAGARDHGVTDEELGALVRGVHDELRVRGVVR